MIAAPSYMASEKSAEFKTGAPAIRYIDSTFFPKIAGIPYHIWDSMEVKYNRENYATTATLTFPRYTQNIKGTKLLNFDEVNFIRSEKKLLGPGGKPLVEINFANELMFYGIIDDMAFDLNGSADEKVTFKCRDLMGELAIARLKAGEHVPNLTSGEVVKKYVDETLGPYGITCIIDPPTTDQLGAFASSQYRFIPANKTKLDIITDMAAFSDRIFYIRGDKFYFVKPRKAAELPTWDITYEKDTRKISFRKNWASEVLVVEGRTKPTVSNNKKKKDLSAKSQMVVERIGHGSIIVKVPTSRTMKYGSGKNKEQAREVLKSYLQSVYDKMAERVISATVDDIPGRIDKREFNFKVRILNVGFGLSQHYLPIEITHAISKEGRYRISLNVANVPEGAEEAVLGGTFAPGEFTADDGEPAQ